MNIPDNIPWQPHGIFKSALYFTRYVMVARTNLEYFVSRVGLCEWSAVSLQLADRYGSGGKPP